MTAEQQRLVDAFESGEMGEVEFFELALGAGLALEAIGRILEGERGEW